MQQKHLDEASLSYSFYQCIEDAMMPFTSTGALDIHNGIFWEPILQYQGTHLSSEL